MTRWSREGIEGWLDLTGRATHLHLYAQAQRFFVVEEERGEAGKEGGREGEKEGGKGRTRTGSGRAGGFDSGERFTPQGLSNIINGFARLGEETIASIFPSVFSLGPRLSSSPDASLPPPSLPPSLPAQATTRDVDFWSSFARSS